KAGRGADWRPGQDLPALRRSLRPGHDLLRQGRRRAHDDQLIGLAPSRWRPTSRSVRPSELIRAFRRESAADALGDLAAMLTYYAIFALFPMIVFVVTLALLIVPDSALQQGIDLATKTMPQESADMVRQYILHLRGVAGGGIAAASVLLALF